VLWEGRIHRLKSLTGVRARIQEAGATDLREVPVTELRGLPSLPITQLDQRDRRVPSLRRRLRQASTTAKAIAVW
jgi:hypothetical protein